MRLRTPFRMSLKTVLVFEASIVALSLLLARLFPYIREGCAHVAAMFSVALLLHALIIPFKRPDFVIYDAPRTSAAKYYWLLTIGISVWVGTEMQDTLLAYIE